MSSPNSQMTKKDEKRLGVLKERILVLQYRMAANAGLPAAKDAEQELLALEWALDRIERSSGPDRSWTCPTCSVKCVPWSDATDVDGANRG